MRKKNPADALFPKIRQNILAATYSQPKKWWFMSELAAFIETTPSSLQRELESLTGSGILRRRRDGNRLYFQATDDTPIFAPLRDLILQTLGVKNELKASLLPLTEKIHCAFIYGSVARADDHATSDVDLMFIGSIGLADVTPLLRKMERKFNREINATCYSTAEFKKKVQSKHHFLLNVLKQKKLFLVGDENELEQLTGESNGPESHDEPAGNKKLARVD